jgi:predicted nucleic acid-binding protein
MIVIADTTPLNYLILTALTQILPELFGQVVIPLAVLHELQAPQAPDKVREWVVHRPAWLMVKEIQQEDPTLGATGDLFTRVNLTGRQAARGTQSSRLLPYEKRT